MKKVLLIALMLFLSIKILAQNAAPFHFKILKSEGIIDIEKYAKELEIKFNGINDTDLCTKLQGISLSFIYEGKVHVLAYGDFDYINTDKQTNQVNEAIRGIYLYRKDGTSWNQVSDKLFTGRYIAGRLIDEFTMMPQYSNETVKVLSNGNILILFRNRIWSTNTFNDLGEFGTFLTYVILYPRNDKFQANVWIPKNKFDYFPDGVDVRINGEQRNNSYYEIKEGDNYVRIESKNRYIQFNFTGNKYWEASPDSLTRIK